MTAAKMLTPEQNWLKQFWKVVHLVVLAQKRLNFSPGIGSLWFGLKNFKEVTVKKGLALVDTRNNEHAPSGITYITKACNSFLCVLTIIVALEVTSSASQPNSR